jgi:hypothetical protein
MELKGVLSRKVIDLYCWQISPDEASTHPKGGGANADQQQDYPDREAKEP